MVLLRYAWITLSDWFLLRKTDKKYAPDIFEFNMRPTYHPCLSLLYMKWKVLHCPCPDKMFHLVSMLLVIYWAGFCRKCIRYRLWLHNFYSTESTFSCGVPLYAGIRGAKVIEHKWGNRWNAICQWINLLLRRKSTSIIKTKFCCE